MNENGYRSGGRAMTAESPQDFVQVGGDGDLVVKEILKPEIIVSMCQGDQGQEISEADADGRLLRFDVEVVLRHRVHTKMRGHS